MFKKTKICFFDQPSKTTQNGVFLIGNLVLLDYQRLRKIVGKTVLRRWDSNKFQNIGKPSAFPGLMLHYSN